MADEIIYTPITDLHPRMMRVLAKRRLPNVSSITVSGWPNKIAETPEEAVGKNLKVEEGGREQSFVVASVEGDRLNLRRIITWAAR